MSKVTKKRNWAFVIYPESTPENWQELLIKTGLPFAVSPLHDSDLNPDGTAKKAHWHVIVCFPGPTTFQVVQALTDSLNAPIPQPVESVKGYFRYFTHMDNPEKAQYDERKITTKNGFNILDYADLTRLETLRIKMKLREIIREMKFTEYAELIDFLADEEMLLELDIATSNTLFVSQYLTSRRHWSDKKAHETHEKPTEICCKNCGSVNVIKRGKSGAGTPIFGCKDCGKKFTI